MISKGFRLAAISVLLASVGALGFSGVSPHISEAFAQQVTGTVTINETCNLSIVSGDPINYGALDPGAITPEQTLVVRNGGNVAALVNVLGAAWLDGDDNAVIGVDSTKYSVASGDYSSKISLSTTDGAIIPSLTPQQDTNTFWQLQANLLDPLFSGSASQSMDFSVTC